MDITQSFIPAESFTAIAQWMNQFFYSFDYKILEFYHKLHEAAGAKGLDFFVECFTRLGDDGIFLILIALILMLFKKTRKVGCTMLGGIGLGFLITNLAIKNIVARPRPYVTLQTYWDWWMSVGHGLESEFSFPSGHTTSAAATLTPVFLWCNKKKSWAVFLFVIALGASRNYIMVHYPSDIFGGIIVGCIAGVIAYLLVLYLYDLVCSKLGKLGTFIQEFDIKQAIEKKKAK